MALERWETGNRKLIRCVAVDDLVHVRLHLVSGSPAPDAAYRWPHMLYVPEYHGEDDLSRCRISGSEPPPFEFRLDFGTVAIPARGELYCDGGSAGCVFMVGCYRIRQRPREVESHLSFYRVPATSIARPFGATYVWAPRLTEITLSYNGTSPTVVRLEAGDRYPLGGFSHLSAAPVAPDVIPSTLHFGIAL